jgi:hypothetical protein
MPLEASMTYETLDEELPLTYSDGNFWFWFFGKKKNIYPVIFLPNFFVTFFQPKNGKIFGEL